MMARRDPTAAALAVFVLATGGCGPGGGPGPDDLPPDRTVPVGEEAHPLALVDLGDPGSFGAPVVNPRDGSVWLSRTEGYDAVARLAPGDTLTVLVPVLGGGGGVDEPAVPVPALGERGWMGYYDCNYGGTWFFVDAATFERRDLPRGVTPNPPGCQGNGFRGLGTSLDGRYVLQHVGERIIRIDPRSGRWEEVTPLNLPGDPELRRIYPEPADGSILLDLQRAGRVREILRMKPGDATPRPVPGLPPAWESAAHDPLTGLLYLAGGDPVDHVLELDPGTGKGRRLPLSRPMALTLGTAGPSSDGAGRSLFALEGQIPRVRVVELPLRSATGREGRAAGGAARDVEAVEGESVRLSVPRPADADAQALLAWAFGDGVEAGAPPTTSHVFLDDGSYRPRAGWGPGRMLRDSVVLRVRVRNAVPSVHADAPDSAVSGQEVPLRIRVSDPGLLDAPWNWEVDWGGDGLRDRGELTDQGATVQVRRSLGAPGPRWIRVRVTDKDGAAVETRTGVNVLPRAVRLLRVEATVPLPLREEDVEGSYVRLAVLGEGSVDATRILVPSLALSQGGRSLGLSARGDGSVRSPVGDVNGDGLPDLVLFLDPDDVDLDGRIPILFRGELPGGYVVEGSWHPGA